MSKMNWVHCNKCYEILSNKQKFYFLSCFHVTCYKCLKEGKDVPFCSVCNCNVALKEITKNLDHQFMSFLKPILSYNLKQNDFQINQLRDLKQYRQKRENESTELKRKIAEVDKKIVERIEIVAKLKTARKKLQANLNLEKRTPTLQVASSTPKTSFDNNQTSVSSVSGFLEKDLRKQVTAAEFFKNRVRTKTPNSTNRAKPQTDVNFCPDKTTSTTYSMFTKPFLK